MPHAAFNLIASSLLAATFGILLSCSYIQLRPQSRGWNVDRRSPAVPHFPITDQSSPPIGNTSSPEPFGGHDNRIPRTMDGAHAHPTSPLTSISSPQVNQQTAQHRRPFHTLPSTPSPHQSPPTLLPRDGPFSLQRRLQLRHSGFRAARFPASGVSARLSRFFHSTEELRATPQPQEKSNPHSTPRRRTSSQQNSASFSGPIRILNEITNSTHSRNSNPDKVPLISIYEDNPERPLLNSSPASTTYHDTYSTPCSPITFDHIHDSLDEMRLREISGNAQRNLDSTPPLSSPLTREIRGRRKRGLNLRKTSFEAAQYIEHIENELQGMKQALTSPTSGKPLKSKLRDLRAENKKLKDSVTQLEDSFEERVQEAVEHKTAVEVDLRRKIKSLEDELITRDCEIRELQSHSNGYSQSNFDALKAMIERLENEKRGLEDNNRSMGQRNDVLAELLGQSPTRSQYGFELVSPLRHTVQRTPRPKSMMIPGMPSPSCTAQRARPMSVQALPAPSMTDYFSPLTALAQEHNHPCDGIENVDPQKRIEDSESVDSGLGESCSIHSHPEPMSKRSSIISQASISPSGWLPPLSSSPTEENETGRASRRRQTRKFASGSTTLKPLVLPTLNAASNIPYSATTTLASLSPKQRDLSLQSIDPTTSFLSQLYETPTQPKRRSTGWAADEALKALEGESNEHSKSFDEIIAQHEGVPAHDGEWTTDNNEADYHQEDAGEHQSLMSLNDEIIFEEDANAFLNTQMPSTEEHSFSSMIAEVSPSPSEIERAVAEDDGGRNALCLEIEPWPPMSSQRQDPASIDYDGQATSQDGSPPSLETILREPLYGAKKPLQKSASMAEPHTLPASHDHPATMKQNIKAANPYSRPRKRRRSDTPSDIVPPSPMPPVRTIYVPADFGGTRSAFSFHKDVSSPTQIITSEASQDPCPDTSAPRPRSPLEALQSRRSRQPIPLTSVTTRTIFGTISRYTSYIREIRRDPTALARRVIANAWCSNWKRLGGLSWWVLGLFLGPGISREPAPGMGRDWEQYDGEGMAERMHETMNPSTSAQPTERYALLPKTGARRVTFGDGQGGGYRTSGSRVQAKPALKKDSDHGKSRKEQKAGWAKSIFLWGKFSVAIMLALGGAVMKGPGEMLKDCEEHKTRRSSSLSRRATPRADSLCQEDNHSHPPSSSMDPDLEAGVDIEDEAPFYEYEEDDNVNADPKQVPEANPEPDYSAIAAGPEVRSVEKKRGAGLLFPARMRKQKSLPVLGNVGNDYTFGSPSRSDWDRFDDNGGQKPVKSLNRSFNQGDPRDQETVHWMNLTLADFQDQSMKSGPGQTYGTMSGRSNVVRIGGSEARSLGG